LLEKLSNLKNKKKIATDMDEVLTLISPLWTYLLLENKTHFSEYMDLDFDYSMMHVLNRDEYYLNNWLSNGKELPEEVFDLFLGLYKDNDKFYSNCRITNFGMTLKILLDRGEIEHIYIVTKVIEGTEDYKKRWVAKYLGTENITFISVDGDTKKSEAINELGIEYDLFIDDCLDNIYDVLKNTNSYNKSFFIPKYGYNKDEEMREKISSLATNNLSTVYLYESRIFREGE